MVEATLIIWLACGLLCDVLVQRRARSQGRPYGVCHFILSMLFGVVMVPLLILVFLWLTFTRRSA